MNKPVTAALCTALLLAGCKGTAEISLGSVGETMQYDHTTFTVKSGQTVHVSLVNNATQPTMKHNWVLVKPGREAAVALAGQAAGEAHDDVPDSADVIAHTPLSTSGQTVEVTFTAPAPGTYPFICTFPGHYLTMKGTLVVTP